MFKIEKPEMINKTFRLPAKLVAKNANDCTKQKDFPEQFSVAML